MLKEVSPVAKTETGMTTKSKQKKNQKQKTQQHKRQNL